MICQRELVAWLLILYCINYAECLVCLKCDTTVKPIVCHDVEHCGPHEVCLAEGFITPSGVKYKIGCVDRMFCITTPTVGKRDIIHGVRAHKFSNSSVQRDERETQFCSECCEGDLCNAEGCGNKGYDNSLGPLCYSCPSEVGPAGCRHIQQCGRDKICQINPIIVQGVEDSYTSSCEYPKSCAPVQLQLGGGAYACSACCNQSLCNSFNTSDDVCKYQLNTLTSTPPLGTRFTSSPVSTSTASVRTHTGVSSTSTTSVSTTQTTVKTTSATHVDCSECAKFHPEVVCSTNTSFVRDCEKYCGWNCSVETTTAAHADCSLCAKFHPEIVCSTNTSLVRNCVQHCGWNCPGLNI